MHRPLHPGAVGHGAPGRHQGLGGHLASEHPQAVLGRAEAAEQVDFQRFQVQPLEQLVQGGGHPSMMACPLAEPDLL